MNQQKIFEKVNLLVKEKIEALEVMSRNYPILRSELAEMLDLKNSLQSKEVPAIYG